jgi:hypothetical protein
MGSSPACGQQLGTPVLLRAHSGGVLHHLLSHSLVRMQSLLGSIAVAQRMEMWHLVNTQLCLCHRICRLKPVCSPERVSAMLLGGAVIRMGNREPGMVVYTCNPALRRLGQEDPKFNTSLGLTASPRLRNKRMGLLCPLTSQNFCPQGQGALCP